MKKLIDKIIAKWLAMPLKQQYLLGFTAAVLVLSFVKPFVYPKEEGSDMVEENTPLASSLQSRVWRCESPSPLTTKKHHRILSVPNYKAAFPDSQSVQIVAANKWGVKPVKNREDAEARKKELVYVGESPYLQDIGQAFYDSLYVKGVPLNQLIVTSVMRSMEDVKKLQRHNGNATDNSCHLYGTTFDICYNRYHALDQEVRNDTLKWVLSEVLRDIRKQDRAYIKYEVKQGCFHMTVR